MFDFHEKRKIRSILYSKPVAAVFFIATILLSFSAYNRYTVASDMKVKLAARHAELEQLEARAQVLESKVNYLDNERGIEEELRNRFDVVKEGEQVVVLIDEKKEVGDKSEPVALPIDEEESGSFFDFLIFWD